MTIDLTQRRTELITLRENLLAGDRALAEAIDSGGELNSAAGDQHLADHASELLERELEGALESNTAHIVEEIDAALAALDDGRYGSCRVCGESIPEERLSAFPYATLCVPHKREVERDRT